MEASTNVEPTELLVTRRSKRSTAGNRMEAALAEMAVEDVSKDLDDDKDFVNDKVEEDLVGSDFESTDEEADKQEQDVGELEVANEERRDRKAKRSRLERTTAAAHLKHKATFNPDIQIQATVSTRKFKAKSTHHVSLGDAVDAESGELVRGESAQLLGNKRTSKRKHTVMSTSATAIRLKQSAAKKASQPKKAKIEHKTFTQAELIALALDTEEGNIVEHRDYLKNEDEKRKRAKVVRATVEGPLLRWTSRNEEVKIVVEPPPPPPVAPILPKAPTPSIHRSVYGPPGSLFTPTTYNYSGGNAMVSTLATVSSPPLQIPSGATPTPSQPLTMSFSHYQPYHDAGSSFPLWPPLPTPPPMSFQEALSLPPPSSTPVAHQNFVQAPQIVVTASQVDTPAQGSQDSLAAAPEPEYRIEMQTKNYLVHELAQRKSHPKPTWMETMTAMFGDHVKWNEIKVFVGKNRPLSRPRQTCPITGRQAHYLDPRTNVPYADSHAYKILTELLQHEYVWNPALGCYLEREKPPVGKTSE